MYTTLKITASVGILSLVGLATFAQPSFAQTLPAQQGNAAAGQANPARVQDSILDDREFGKISPKTTVKDLVLQGAPPNSENIKFVLKGINFEGVGVYSDAEIASLYQDKVDSIVTLAEIYGIANATTNKYRNDGYILTQVVIPPQEIDGGVVTMRAVEGFVDQITVTGNDNPNALKTIRAYAQNIQNEGPLNAEDLEKFLLLINDLPGLTARSILSPSPTLTGASDLQIIVERDAFEGFLGVNNHGSRYLGPIQFTAAGALNSYFGMNERITAQFVTAPHNHELYFGALGYDQAIGNYGTMAKALFSYSNTEPGFDLDQFDVKGRSRFASIGFEHPFLRSREQSLYGNISFDWRNVESRNNIEATRKDRIRALRIGGRYQVLDQIFSAGLNSFNFQYSQGLDIAGASDKGDANLSRPAGDPQFSKVNAEIQRLQRVTSSVNILLSARGQLSNNALLSSEEFGVGGTGYGRGYDSSEIVGEDGIAGKIEAQWKEPIKADIFESYQVYSFYDVGKVWNDDNTIADDDESLASVGLGIRADFANDFSGGLSVALPLTRKVQTQRDEGARVYFNLNKKF